MIRLFLPAPQVRPAVLGALCLRAPPLTAAFATDAAPASTQGFRPPPRPSPAPRAKGAETPKSGPRMSREHPMMLRQLRQLSQFTSLHDKLGQNILRLDLAEPLQALATLIEKADPKADVAGHPRVRLLLEHIRSALDRSSWQTPSAADRGAAGPADAERNDSGIPSAPSETATPPPPEHPSWRYKAFRSRELCRLATLLVQMGLAWRPEGVQLLTTLRGELVRVAATCGAEDLYRAFLAFGSTRLMDTHLWRALCGHLRSQLPHMDGNSVADVAHFLGEYAPKGCASDPLLMQAVALRLATQLALRQPKSMQAAAEAAGMADAAPTKPRKDGPASFRAAKSAGPVDPAKLGQALSALAAANLRSESFIRAHRRGYSLGGAVVERALCKHVVQRCTRWGPRTLATVARAVGTMGLTWAGAPGAIAGAGALSPHGEGHDEEASSADVMWEALERCVARSLPSLTPLDLSFVVTSFASASRTVALEVATAATMMARARRGLRGRILQPAGLGLDDDDGAGAGAAAASSLSLVRTGSPRVGSNRLWAGLRTAVLGHVPSAPPKDVSFALWAFATVGLADGPLTAAAAARFALVLHEATTATAPPPSSMAPAPSSAPGPTDAAVSPASATVAAAGGAATGGASPTPVEGTMGEAPPSTGEGEPEAAAVAAGSYSAGDGAPPSAPSESPSGGAAAWGPGVWAALARTFGNQLLRSCANLTRTIATVPALTMMNGASDEAPDGSGGGAPRSPSSSLRTTDVSHLCVTASSLAQVTATVARALFEAASGSSGSSASVSSGTGSIRAPKAARRKARSPPRSRHIPTRAGHGGTSVEPLVPLNLPDVSLLLDSTRSYATGLTRVLATGLLGRVAPGDEALLREQVGALHAALVQLAAAASVRVAGASDRELSQSASPGAMSNVVALRRLVHLLRGVAGAPGDGDYCFPGAAGGDNPMPAVDADVSALILQAAARLEAVREFALRQPAALRA